ncbi:sugar ABC transporter permease [Staphylococcus shinii]|uniref:Sugar ABC transporter permease n=1 Tax=Staphylococcus shinii TaxID=2912228 RepID=A0A418ID99_9STAP|nr:sugar ABC transporter permease [Staphylococcus shinii]MDW8565376.1 sugar ABC transporter permease [Staphylococcus shinii]MDW8568627.1 sugar ABC transporter permease [Staphylococcus shinii]RIM98411.1 sugar ABC transporter permease [Staphylococcus shinii]RIN08877.1 sugar ABC transporter permease [Staphylococcus shinii]
MIDSMISYFKNTPYLMKHAYHRLKSKWMWLAAPFVVSIALLLIMMLIFHLSGTEEIKQARGYFRLTSLVCFAFIWIAIYQSYNTFKTDYFVGKLFNLNPVFQNILISIVISITMFITLIIIILATPVNIESSIYSALFFVVMTMLFIIIISTFLGLISIIQSKINTIFYGVTFIMFFTVPIIFIPNSDTSILLHILMLNPLFYLVEGISQSVVLGTLSLNNIPYHLYFVLFLAIMGVLIYALYRIVAHKKYDYVKTNSHTEETTEANPQNNNVQHTAE